MRALLVMGFVVMAAAPVAAKDFHVDIPPGWTEHKDEAATAQLEKLKSIKGTKAVEATIYMSADFEKQMTVMRWQTKLAGEPTQKQLRELDRGMVKGTAGAASKHLSDSQRFADGRLYAESADELDGMLVKQSRVYAVDSNDVVHMLVVVCAGPANALGDCEAAQRSMRLELATQVTPPEDKSFAYQLGYGMGVLLIIGLIGLVIRRLTK